MDNYTNNINIQDILGSVSVLDNLVSGLSTMDLNSYFIELENYIKKINFEHGNCINEYRDDLKYIIDEVQLVKKEIFHLDEALCETCNRLQDKDVLNNQDLGDLSSLYNGSINGLDVSNNVNSPLYHNSNGAVQLREASNSVLESINTQDVSDSGIYKIPPVDQNTTTTQSEEINTIPIGLGIAATGITASVGAVVVDDMKSKKNNKKIELDEYKEDNDSNNISSNNSDYYLFGKEVLESNDQYQASRNKKEMDKFYGVNHEYYENEDE